MPRIARDARYEWLLLQSVYSIFERSLPPVNNTEKAKLKLHLVQGQANQYMTKKDFRRFLDALKNLLGIFESFVNSDLAGKASEAVLFVSDPNAPEVAKAQAEVDVESRYPRLVALKIILSICEPIRHSSLPSNVQLLPGTTIPSITESLNDFEDKIRSSHFKYSEYKLADTRIRGFNAVVDDLLQGKLRGSASKGRFNNLKDDEIVVIQDVEHCRSSFDSLFQLLVRNMPCSNLHSAWVHLSGFRRRELDVVIVACHDNQKHTATCRSSHQISSTNTGHEAKIFCHQRTTQEHSQLAFNDNSLWHDAQSLSSTTQVTSTNISLRNLLRDGGVVNQHGELCEFEREDHKSVELLLAHSLLFLGGTFWLQSCVSMDQITSFPSVDADNALDRWRLHLPCDLHGHPPLAYDQIEQIYAFGVFLMEMETGLRAQSLPVEPDYEDPRGGPRMDAILETMLAEWARKVDDGYLQVAKACLDFRESAEAMAMSLNEHRPRLKDTDARKLKDAATIFKLIVLPLERLLADRHAAAHQLFRNFSLHTRQIIVEEMSFYDDVPSKEGSPEGNTFINRAKVFLEGMQASIVDVCEIAQSCRSPLCLGDPVKIAILDTGVDLSDPSIEEYMRQKRIVDHKGFAGDAKDVQDKNGHGTHVARILIKNAPVADFYIAKVSNNTKVPATQLAQVAEAIKWALVDMNVDIVSMSFGWHERNLEINKALGKAQDHQVMFAAASNDGERGHSGPTFPAQKGRVFCINACDGIGKPATFNPPALEGNSFMTLGLGIESYWKSEKVYKSGTSFATPMAAAMVANALEFTRYQCGTVPIPDEACAFLNSFDGVRKLIELMTNQSTSLKRPHPYTYMDPSRIWDRKRDRSDIAELFIAACTET